MTTDPIAAARALIEPLTGYTPGPWEGAIYDDVGFLNFPLSGYDGDFEPDDARLIAAAPDLRDMVATLADALEAERAKVAAARLEGWRAGLEAAADCAEDYCSDMPDLSGHGHSVGLRDAIRDLPEPKEASDDCPPDH